LFPKDIVQVAAIATREVVEADDALTQLQQLLQQI
jgi:hypothetical protein